MQRHSQRVTFTGSLGFPLAGIVDRPLNPPQPPPVAVFSHCFTCNKDLKAIVRISRALSQAGVAVLRFDMTGLGGSEGDFSRTSFTSNLGDLRSAIAFARSELGAVDALIGHSLGGAASLAVAAQAAESAPPAVLTLAAPSDTKHLAELLCRMAPDLNVDDPEACGRVSIGGVRWTIRRSMVTDFLRHDLPANIAQIQSHVLAFHSPVDKTVGFDHALRIQSLLLGGKATAAASLVALHGADHLLSQCPEDIALVSGVGAAFIHRNRRPL